MEIKFKAKRIDNHLWAVGNYTKHNFFRRQNSKRNLFMAIHNIDCINDDELFDNVYKSVMVNPLTVCQFTGIYDANNKEIYSDDVLEDDKGLLFRVYQTKGGFVFKGNYWKQNLADIITTDSLILESMSNPQNISYINQSCTVKLNIHD